VKKEEPHVLILLGPFIDEKHKMVQDGSLQLLDHYLEYSELFESCVSAIHSFVKGLKTRVFLQPSIRDIHFSYPFPQPAFEIKKEYSTNICGISNPQKLLINDVEIQILGADIFNDMMESTMVSKPKGNTQESVVKSVFEQASLYPIFPVASVEFPVDYKFESKFAMNSQPDILIVQSSQPCFAYVFYQ